METSLPWFMGLLLWTLVKVCAGYLIIAMVLSTKRASLVVKCGPNQSIGLFQSLVMSAWPTHQPAFPNLDFWCKSVLRGKVFSAEPEAFSRIQQVLVCMGKPYSPINIRI